VTNVDRARAAAGRGRDREVARYRRVLMERDRAAELTGLLARTWPPRSVRELDGWRLRTGRGLPAHAASAWPRSAGERMGLRARLEGTQRHYAAAGLTPGVLVSPAARPSGTEAALRRHGWSPRHAAEIRTGELAALRALAPADDVTVALTEHLDDRWLAAWATLTGRGPAERDGAAVSLDRCEAMAAYLTAWRGEQLAGVARAVVDGCWVGVPDLVVTGDSEVAASLAQAIATWAAGHHVEQVWWLVAQAGDVAGQAADIGGSPAVEATRRAGLAAALRLQLRVAAVGAGNHAFTRGVRTAG
jgi:ketosteroid isomerase-like protein